MSQDQRGIYFQNDRDRDQGGENSWTKSKSRLTECEKQKSREKGNYVRRGKIKLSLKYEN